jgi:DNA-binding PadR family transcriptional regulator
MAPKTDVWQGTLALMVLKTLDAIGPLHGYGIARRIEQTSGNLLSINYGTLYPALLKLEQEGYISSAWDVSRTIAGRSGIVSRAPPASCERGEE